MIDIVLEFVRTGVICFAAIFLWRAGRRAEIHKQAGWWLIIAGFFLISFAAALDITDNFPSLNRYVLIGHTPAQAFLESVVGYLGGLLLILVGLVRWMPTVAALKETRDALKESHDQLEQKVKEQTAYLERRVEERTAALTSKNAQLTVEVDRRRQTEADLIRHKERLELALWGADLVMWDWDIASGEVVHGDGAVLVDEHAVKDAKLTIDQWQQNVHPDDWPLVHTALTDHLEGRSPAYEVEFRHSDGSGGWLWVLSRGKIVQRDEHGRPLRMAGSAADISSRKRVEQALRESEEKYRHIFQNSHDAVGIVDRKTLQILDVNPAAEKLYGYSREELLGLNCADLSTRPDRVRALAESIEHGALVYLPDVTHRKSDGTIVPVEVSASVFSMQNRDVALFIARDITSRVRATEQLEEAKERYRIVADFAHDWDYWSEIDGTLLYMAPSCKRITGYSVEEFTEDPELLVRIVHPDDREAYAEHREQVRRSPDTPARSLDFRVVRKDGAEVWINHVCRPVYGRLREPRGRRVSNRDITDRKQVEAELHASRQSFTSIVENSSDAILVLDPSGKVLYGNPATSRMFGCDDAGLVGMSFGEPLAGGEGCEIEVIQADGVTGIAEMRVADSLWNLQPARLVILRDVTERRRYEDALRSSEERMRLLIESSPIGIKIARNGVYQYVNPAFIRMFGYDRAEEIVGLPVEALYRYGDQDPTPVTEHDSIDHAGVAALYESRGVKKDGQEFDVSVWLKTIDYQGLPALLGFVIDVSEERTLRSQLLHAQKMEAIGTLSGGIAHDFNNILTVISGFTELLLLDKPADHPEHEDLTKVAIAARKGADLVRGLLAFSRKAESKPRPINLNHEVEQVVNLLSRTVPKMITIETRLENKVKIVNADSAQIEQVLINLALNARDAMPEGGTLTIETRNEYLDEASCRTHVGLTAGEHVRLTVRDTGCGMDAQTVSRIFEPFFTTKEAGRGTGLGLAIVYGIITQHSGAIECRSQPGHGTVFDIFLPVFRIETEYAAPSQQVTPRGGTETILLVDDEELVRDLGTRLLTRAGYHVLNASDGVEALEVYTRLQQEVALVVLDLIMPRMGGKECFAELRRIDPSVKVLVASGYASGGHSGIADELGAQGFLKKPYDPVTFLRNVRETLDNG